MMQKIKKLVPLLICLLTLTACGYTAEEKLKMSNYKRIGEKNAISYIKEKYDFTPSVVSSQCATYNSSPVLDFSPGPTGYVYVKLSDKKRDKEFWVYTTGQESNSQECWDNYQHEEIEAAIEQQVEALLGVDTEHIDLAYGRFDDIGRTAKSDAELGKKYGLLRDYYDGTNLAEVLSNAEANKLLACMVDEDYIPDLLGRTPGELLEAGTYEGSLEKEDELVQIFGENMEYLFVNLKDAEAYESTHQEGCVSTVIKHPLNSTMEDYYFYIKDQYYIEFSPREKSIFTEYEKYEVKQFADFYYITRGGTYCNFIDAEAETDPAGEWNGYGFINAKRVYNAYRVDTDAERVYLYIPVSALAVEDVTEEMLRKSDIRIANQFYRESEDSIAHSAFITDLIGSQNAKTEKYLTATLRKSNLDNDVIFTVMVDEYNQD